MRLHQRHQWSRCPRSLRSDSRKAGRLRTRRSTVSGAKYKLNGQIVKTEETGLITGSGRLRRYGSSRSHRRDSKHPNLSPLEKLTWPLISASKPFTSQKGRQSVVLLSWQGCRRSFNFATGISWRMSLCPHCSASPVPHFGQRHLCPRQHEPPEFASIQGNGDP